MKKVEHSAALLQLRDHAWAHMPRIAVTVFKQVFKTTTPIGTAFLLGSTKNITLVTAGHVLEECLAVRDLQEGSAYFFVDYQQTCPIFGRHLVLPDVDIGVVHLAHPIARLASRRNVARPLDLNSVRQLQPHGRADAFVMTGTPLNRVKASAAEKKVNVYPASVVTFEHSPEVYRALGVEPKQRLVVEFDRKSINGDGKMMPRPTGMSGGPLWGAYPNGLGAWSYFLSGVLIEHHKQEDAVVCSRITSVLKAIEMLEE